MVYHYRAVNAKDDIHRHIGCSYFVSHIQTLSRSIPDYFLFLVVNASNGKYVKISLEKLYKIQNYKIYKFVGNAFI